jgi:hypothetical protein
VYQTPEDLRQRTDAQLRDAARYVLGVVAVAGVFLAFAAVWVSTCGGSVADALACGVPQRTLLALGAPLILGAGGGWAFVRGYQQSRRHGPWWAWQGAGWLLLTLTLLVLAAGTPTVAGPAVLG